MKLCGLHNSGGQKWTNTNGIIHTRAKLTHSYSICSDHCGRVHALSCSPHIHILAYVCAIIASRQARWMKFVQSQYSELLDAQPKPQHSLPEYAYGN